MSRTIILLAFLPAVVVPALLIVGGSLWPAVIAYHVYCVATPLASRCSPRKAGLVASQPARWLPLTVTLVVLLVAGGELAREWIATIEPLLPSGWERVLEQAQPWWMFVGYSLAVNVFCEEYLWRGFLMPKTGIGWGAALFWLMHVTAAAVFVDVLAAVTLTLPSLVAGLAWGVMRRRFGSLWPSLLTHLAADIAILRIASAFPVG